jgi:signal peptidase I
MTALGLSLLAVFGALAAVVVWLRRRLVTVTVSGHSMTPTLLPGDRVLVRRTPVRRVGRADLLVFARPRTAERAWMIKRVLAVPGDPVPRREVPVLWGYSESRIPANRLVVLGDNPAESYDSRDFGYVSAEAVLGVMIAQFPSGGREWLSQDTRKAQRRPAGAGEPTRPLSGPTVVDHAVG